RSTRDWSSDVCSSDLSYDTTCWMARQGIEMEPAVSLSAVKVGNTLKWSPGAVIRAKHEGVGLSAMWFRTAERQGVEIRYDSAVEIGRAACRESVQRWG